MPLDHDRSRPVSKEDAGRAVLPVGEPRQDLGPYEEDVLIHAGPDERIGNGHSVDEPRTGCSDIEGSRIFCAELVLQHASHARQDGVRRHGGHQNEVQILGPDPRGFQRFFPGFIGKVGRGLALFRDPALLDARAFGDPAVARVNELFQILVGDDLFRGERTRSCYPRVDHFAFASSIFFSMSSWRCLLTSLFASSAATRMAFLIARSEDLPWLMMLMPLMPMRGAPPYSA